MALVGAKTRLLAVANRVWPALRNERRESRRLESKIRPAQGATWEFLSRRIRGRIDQLIGSVRCRRRLADKCRLECEGTVASDSGMQRERTKLHDVPRTGSVAFQRV